MKIIVNLFALSFLILTTSLYSQRSDNIYTELEFSSFYKFHSGDNFEWVKPAYDDSSWMKFEDGQFPKDEWTGIGWFRFFVKVDSTLMNEPMGIIVKQVGAVEVYSDGNLIYKYGQIGHSVEEEKPRYVDWYPEPAIISFNPKTISVNGKYEYLIAVRYSSFVLDLPISGGAEPKLSIDIGDIDRLNSDRAHYRRKATIHQMLLTGFFLAFALIHGMFFWAYPKMRANLYFTIIAVGAAMIVYTKFEGLFISNPHMYLWSIRLYQMLGSVVIIFTLRLIYFLVKNKLPRLFYIIVSITIIFSIAFFIRPYLMLTIIIFFDGIIFLEILRNILIVMIKKQDIVFKDSWIILAGVIPISLVFLYQLLIYSHVAAEIYTFVDFPRTFYAMLLFAVSMSIFLSRNFAETNKDLELQIENVKKLSEKTLRQELERVRLQSENDRKSEELEKARILQLSMLPKEMPNIPDLDIAVYMQTATEVGGDYYDYNIEDDGTLSIAFGDATGHGMQAGTMVTAVKSLFKSLSSQSDPSIILSNMSSAIKKMGLGKLFMAMTILKVKDNNISASSAGMPFIAVYKKSTSEVEEMELPGMPLGAIKDFPYKIKRLSLNHSDSILLMSDGYTELFNEKDEMLGEEKAYEVFKNAGNNSAKKIIDDLKLAGNKWANGRTQADDISLMVIKFINS